MRYTLRMGVADGVSGVVPFRDFGFCLGDVPSSSEPASDFALS
jgi:hypothetical protein